MRYTFPFLLAADTTDAGAIGEDLTEAFNKLENMEPNQILSALEGFFRSYGLRLLWTAGLFVAGYLLVGALLRLIRRLLRGSKIDSGQHAFIMSSIRILSNVVLLITCLGALGVQLSPLITVLGAGGLALSLALQGTLGNIAGGISVLFSKPFSKENFVDIGGVTGTVKEIGLIYTLLHTIDNKHVYLPNGDVSKATVINYSREKLRRVDILFPVRATADLARVKGIIREVIAQAPLAAQNPQPIVRADDITHALVKISCCVWTEPANVLDLKAYLIETVRARLTEEGY